MPVVKGGWCRAAREPPQHPRGALEPPPLIYILICIGACEWVSGGREEGHYNTARREQSARGVRLSWRGRTRRWRMRLPRRLSGCSDTEPRASTLRAPRLCASSFSLASIPTRWLPRCFLYIDSGGIGARCRPGAAMARIIGERGPAAAAAAAVAPIAISVARPASHEIVARGPPPNYQHYYAPPGI